MELQSLFTEVHLNQNKLKPTIASKSMFHIESIPIKNKSH